MSNPLHELHPVISALAASVGIYWAFTLLDTVSQNEMFGILFVSALIYYWMMSQKGGNDA